MKVNPTRCASMMAQPTNNAIVGIPFSQTLHAAWTGPTLPTGWMVGCLPPTASTFHPVGKGRQSSPRCMKHARIEGWGFRLWCCWLALPSSAHIASNSLSSGTVLPVLTGAEIDPQPELTTLFLIVELFILYSSVLLFVFLHDGSRYKKCHVEALLHM